ncbi:MAG: PAS domain S-box protein [Candidatus Helarchaeota archaeon]
MSSIKETIERTNKFFQLITETCHDLIAILRVKYLSLLKIPKFEFEYINEVTHLEVLGYLKRELIGQPLTKIIHPNSYKYALGAFLKILKEGEGLLEAEVIKKDGKTLWVETKGRVFNDIDGLTKILIVSRDITNKKIVELKLRKSESKYRLITENVNDLIAIFNEKGEYEYLNEEPHKRILGYSYEDLIGNSINKILHPEFQTKLDNQLRTWLKAGEGRLEILVQHKNGEYRWLESRARFFKDETGSMKAIAISRDITERKEWEEALRKSEEKYRQIVENVSEGIWILDAEDKTTYVNQQMMNILEFQNPNEVLNRPVLSLLGDTHKQIIKGYLDRRRQGIRESIDFEMITSKGKNLFLRINSSPIFDDEGNYKGAVSLISDVTQQKLAERQLKESEEHFKLIAEQSLMGIIIMQNGVIKYANEATVKILEYDVEELLEWQPHGFQRLIHPEDSKLFLDQEQSENLKTVGMTEHYSYRIKTKFGKIKWISHYSKRIRYQGKLADLITILDITEQRIAEEKLRESEAQFKLIAEQSLMGIAILQEGVMKYANDALSIISGYPIEEMLQWEPYEFKNFVHLEDRDFVLEQVRKKQKGSLDVMVNYNIRIITKSGQLKWVSLYSKSVPYKGKFADLVTLIDIDERKKTEELLRKSEEKYRFIAENMDDIIAIINENLKIEYANEAVERISGFSLNEIMGRSVLKFLHPSDYKRALDLAGVSLLTGSGRGEFRIVRKNGDYIWIEVRGRVIQDKDNQRKIILVNRVIDERKKLEQELKESEELYRSLIKTSPDSVTITDLQGRIIEVSRRTLEMARGTMEDFIGKSAFEFIHPKDHTRALENLQKTLKEGFVGPLVYTFLRKDGTSYLGELNAALVKNADGTPRGFIATIRDITNRKLAEEKLKESEKNYREAYNRAEFYKDLLSHDMSNILQGIIFSAETALISLDDPEKLRQKLIDIKDHVKKSAKLISSIRKLSKLEEGEPELQPVEIHNFLKNAIHFIHRSFPRKQIEIKIDNFSQNARVIANELLQDVFENLMHNAIKYNRNSKVEINIQIKTEQKDNRPYVRVDFIDNGIGIKDKSKQAIFERGFRENGNVSGRGLGLSLSKKIIESYGGEIWVENRVEEDYSQGSDFIIRIPAAISSEAQFRQSLIQ